MFKKAKDFVKNLKGVTFEHTKLPEGYEKATYEYKSVRDLVGILGEALKNLGNYEHGGNFMKKMTSISNTISSTTKIKTLHHQDLYSNLAKVGENLSDAAPDSGISEIGEKFSRAFLRLSEEKSRMNEKLGNILVSLSALKKETKSIDSERKGVEELRSKTEEVLKDASTSESSRNKVEAEYNFSASQVLEKMRNFTSEKGVAAGALVQAAGVYKEFMALGVEVLSKVK